MTAIHREPYGLETPTGFTFDQLVREALDADEQHGNVRGIKYAILAVAQAIRDVPEALRDMHVLTEVERDIAAADAFDALVGAISRGVRETRRAA